MNHEDLEKEAARLQMSKTLERLFHLAQSCPIDVKNPNDLKAAFSTCSNELIKALDNDRIEFKNEEDKAMFYGLLAVTVDYVLQGKLKNLYKVTTHPMH